MSTMALKLPSSFVDVEREEMEYIDGGISWSSAEALVYGAIGYAVSRIVGRAISGSVIGEVCDSIGGWFAGAIDTAVLAVWYNPVAAGVAVAGLIATVYSVGHWGFHKW